MVLRFWGKVNKGGDAAEEKQFPPLFALTSCLVR
jgi:hypothetical protein